MGPKAKPSASASTAAAKTATAAASKKRSQDKKKKDDDDDNDEENQPLSKRLKAIEAKMTNEEKAEYRALKVKVGIPTNDDVVKALLLASFWHWIDGLDDLQPEYWFAEDLRDGGLWEESAEGAFDLFTCGAYNGQKDYIIKNPSKSVPGPATTLEGRKEHAKVFEEFWEFVEDLNPKAEKTAWLHAVMQDSLFTNRLEAAMCKYTDGAFVYVDEDKCEHKSCYERLECEECNACDNHCRCHGDEDDEDEDEDDEDDGEDVNTCTKKGIKPKSKAVKAAKTPASSSSDTTAATAAAAAVTPPAAVTADKASASSSSSSSAAAAPAAATSA